MKMRDNKRAFTLIELLIVVAIIAILAVIAVPNFLEAQVRSKVSRVKADLRSLATGLEAYRVDNNDYPPVLPDTPADILKHISLEYIFELTTPVAYMTSVALKDPFQANVGSATPFYITDPGPGPEWIGSFNYFKYDNWWSVSACYGDTFTKRAYSILSNGPGKTWAGIEHYPYVKTTGIAYGGLAIAEDSVYEASNGTKSKRGIARFGGFDGGVPGTLP